MPEDPSIELIGGPYHAPHTVHNRDKTKGSVVTVGNSDAPIKWPLRMSTGGRTVPVLCGDLVKAVRTESVSAIAHHWGVSRWTVMRWRRLLGVPQFTDGTRYLWSHLAEVRFGEFRRKQRKRLAKRNKSR